MDEVISRQAAISAICNACGKIDCDKMDKCDKLQLPPANNSEFPNSSDTISRAKAIEAIDEIESEIAEGFGFEYEKWRKYFCDLPPAQPEIIRCKDCKWYGFYSCELHGNDWMRDGNGFCDRAERREE